MRSNWVGNHQLQAIVAAKDGGAALHPEVVVIEDAHAKLLPSEWSAGTQSPGGFAEILASGGARITSFAASVIALNANNGSSLTKLTHVPTFDAVVVEWLAPGAENREIHNLVARLDPRRDGGQPKTVHEWRAQLFRVAEVFSGGVEEGGVVILPISREVVVSATGEADADFTFDFQALSGGRYPRVGPPPKGAAPNANPLTVIRVIGVRDDGSPADNVAWMADAAESSQTDGVTYSAITYSFARLLAAPEEHIGGSAFRILAGGAYPEFTLDRTSFTQGTITFTGSEAIPNLPGTGDLVIVARGETPSDSRLTFEISDDNGVTWEECFDGDLIGVDNSARGGADLSAIATTGPWAARVTLTPSSDGGAGGGFSTPTVREFGIERSSSTWLTGVAEIEGGAYQIDPVTLRGNIPAADLVIAKTGEADYRDIGSRLLSQNHIGDISVRLWVGATVRESLPRRLWMLHSLYDVDDYVSDDRSHRVRLVSPLRRLRNVIIPPFVPTSGADGVRTAVTVPSSAGTIRDAYDELIDGMVGLAGRLRGPSPDDATNSAQKGIVHSEAKEEADRLAYLSGGSIVESQGRIGFVRVMRDGPGSDTPLEIFPLGSYIAGDFGPGYSVRTDEFFVKLNWDVNRETFEDERRYFNGVALDKLGGVGMNTTQELDEETCKWIISEALADEVGRRVPHHFATGQIVLPIKSHRAYPALEQGDPVALEMTQFVGRSPLSDEEIRGRVWALGIVVYVGDAWGTEFNIWVPSFDKIVPADGDVTLDGFVATKTITFPGISAVPVDDTVPVDISNGDLRNRTAGIYSYSMPLALPLGAKLTKCEAALYRDDTDGEASIVFSTSVISGATVFPTDLATLTHTGTGWQTSSGTFTHTVSASRIYHVSVVLDNAAGAAADERLAWVRLTYQ